MGDAAGFKKHDRETPRRRPVAERIEDYREVYEPFPDDKLKIQASRCMDCGIPFCHNACPVNNVIPDWNDLAYRDRWREAGRALHATNNFPEFTGRICPAPCEASCVLGINAPPVAIKLIEKTIADRAWREGWLKPEPPETRTGREVAVVGSGPSGLAAAQQLNRAGHRVTVFEKSDRIGGLLRYGIPDFKLEKEILDRRISQIESEGVEFRTGACVGKNPTCEELRGKFDAILLAGGAENPRDMSAPGRDLKGIHFAMEFLPQQNRRNAGDSVADQIVATGKNVIILGGGDTGADCLGTCHRQKAKSVRMFEIMPAPPPDRAPSTPWPLWPLQLRTESAHEEGGIRDWSIATVGFAGDEAGRVSGLKAVRVGPPPRFEPVPGTEILFEADLVLLALGFTGPVKNGMLEELGVKLDARGNVATGKDYMTSVPGVFSAGDMRRGQSLVVWAISEGRNAASALDFFLKRSY